MRFIIYCLIVLLTFSVFVRDTSIAKNTETNDSLLESIDDVSAKPKGTPKITRQQQCYACGVQNCLGEPCGPCLCGGAPGAIGECEAECGNICQNGDVLLKICNSLKNKHAASPNDTPYDDGDAPE